MAKILLLLFLFIYCKETVFSQTDSSRKAADSTRKTVVDATRKIADSAHKAATDSSHYIDTVHYYLNYSATGTINTSNALHSYVLNNAFKFNRSKKSATLNAYGNWVYGESQHILINNDFSTGLDFDLYKSLRHFYYWGLATYTTSYSLRINGQLQAGAGIGYNVVDKKTAVLILSDGLVYERADLNDTLFNNGSSVNYHDKYNIVRNSFRILFHLSIKDLIILDGTEFFQPSLASSKDYIIKSGQSISFRLNKWLNFTTSLLYNRFTRTQSQNLLFNFGLTIDKHF